AVGSRITDAFTQEAINRSLKFSTSLFTAPFTKPGSSVTMVYLVIPADLGEDVRAKGPHDRSVWLARLSLSTLIRTLVDKSFDYHYRTTVLVDGKAFPPVDSEDDDTPSENFHTTASLSPLPPNVAIATTNVTPQSIYSHTTLVRGILIFGALLIAAIFWILHYQFRQMNTETLLRARVIVQQALSQSLLDGVCATDRKGRVLFTNGAFLRMFGLKAQELTELTPPYRICASQTDAPFARILSADSGAQTTHKEFEARRKNGAVFDCSVSIVPLRPRTKFPRRSGWLLIFRDITQQKRAREALQLAHERTLLVLEAMDATVSVVRRTTDKPELVYANRRYISAFGETVVPHMKLCDRLREVGPAQATGEVWVPERKQWLACTLRSIGWLDNTMVEILTVRDVTERKNAEALIDQQLKNAEQSSRLITMGEMTSSLAHELNQPLAAVQNYASAAQTMLLADKLTGEGANTALTKIINQTQRAAQIIKRIRGFAKRTEAQLSETALSRILDETMELALIQSKKLGVRLNLDVQSNVKTLMCDAVMIEQVLFNLVKNAMEASLTAVEAGAPKSVRLCVKDEAPNIVFYVIDNGTGISETDAEHLFDPFYTTKKTGMGIGLNICRTIVESHHGRLTFENNPEGGTIFRLSLPARQSR
ncbi:MAG: ATP-binding protein, partial [Duodenibacillus sp.]